MDVVALCRLGFEKELAAELGLAAASLGVAGYPKTREGQGYVQFVCNDWDAAHSLLASRAFEEWVFVRDWFISTGQVTSLNPEDRVSPLLESLSPLQGVIPALGDMVYLNIDSNDGKALGKLTRGVGGHCKRRLGTQANSDWVGVLLLLSGTSGFLGVCPRDRRPRWPGGVARLKFPREAPSRATLKLEEAWHHFIPASQWPQRLAGGMRAVDLGAAPGGWTYQLVAKSLFVDAVDNGPMAASLMDSGQVRHHEKDGFLYRPAKPVDWLVCDIADKPARVAATIALWAENAWCREAVFNLKLPMKKRFQEVQHCAELISERMHAARRNHLLRFKQLYHDREEVTGWLYLL